MTKQLHHLANIRDLLLNGFDDLDLRRLCFDVPDFRPVYDRLARSTGKARIVDELLEYSEKTLQIDTLLALARERNATRYELHGPYYADDPTPALQKQVSDLAQRLAAISSPTSLTRQQQYQIAFHWRGLGGEDSLRGFDLQEADLIGVDLGTANLSDADLRGANLCGANLSGADLSGADLSRADLAAADLGGVDLNWAELRYANLRGANLNYAELHQAQLIRADLSEANLRYAKLRHANLAAADVGGADLNRADLMDANVTPGQLDQAKSLEGATMPDGTKYTS